MKHFSVGPRLLAIVLLTTTVTVRASTSFFDVFVDNSPGPPYPSTPPVHTDVRTNLTTPVLVLTYNVRDVVPVTTLDNVGSDSGGPTGSAGSQMFFNIFAGEPSITPHTLFDIRTTFSLMNGTPAHLIGTPIINFSSASFFDVYSQIDLPGVGIQTLHNHWEIGAGQPWTFSGATITGSAGGTSMDFLFYLDGSGSVNSGALVTMGLDGAFAVPEPSTLGLFIAGGFALLWKFRRRSI
jgi:hypothetical protein